MPNPVRWFTNLIRLQEKRPYSTFVLLLFCIFVALTRTLLEWVLGALPIALPFSVLSSFVVFYWTCLFWFIVIVRLCVPAPWRSTASVVLVGVFLGIFPPLIDVLATGYGKFSYLYDFDFPKGFGFALHAPAVGAPIGETITLWSTVFFTFAYVAARTRTLWRALLAGVLCYGVILWNAALLPTLVSKLARMAGLPEAFEAFILVSLQALIPLVLYLAVLRPQVGAWLLRRSQHSVPFVLMCLIGGLLTARWHHELAVYAGFLFVVLLVWLGQNDLFDREEDAAQGRPALVDEEDVRFLNVSVALLLLGLFLNTSSVVGMPLLLFLAVSFLYSYPFYRGKRFFPANLKMEGAWGFSAFLVGAVSAMEHLNNKGMPPWSALDPATNSLRTLSGPFPVEVGVVMALVFGGYSVVAALKDYKDWRADLGAGVQTLYTLAHRRGRSVEKLHRFVVVAAVLCTLASVPLLTLVRTVPPALLAVGALPSLLLGYTAWSKRRFSWVLLSVDLHLAYLAFVLATT